MSHNIKEIIENKNISAFKEAFSNLDLIQSFVGTNDKNILHVLGENASIDFFKKAYKHLQEIDKDYTKSLLLKRNINGRLPANKEFSTHDDKSRVSVAIGTFESFVPREMNESEAKKNEVYTFLKRETKQIMNKEKSNLFHYGAEFSQTMPGIEHYLAESKFYFPVAYYPTVRLLTNIEHNETDKRRKGLNRTEKSDASYINHYTNEVVENYIEEYDEIVHSKQVIKGEFTSIDYIPITERNLGIVVAEELDFPEDFTKSLAMLNSIGDTIKVGLKDEMLQPIFRNLIQNNGVIVADDNEKVSYFGLCNFNEHIDVEDYNVLSIFPSSSDEITNTTNHEMTHAADYNFSDSSLMKAYVTLMSGDKDIPKKIKEIFKNNAESYESNEFSSEALAEINAVVKDKDCDPMTAEIFKAFSKYATSCTNQKYDLSEFIEEVSEVFQNKDEIMGLYKNKLMSKIDDKAKHDYASPSDKKRIKEKLIPEFIQDIKTINLTIDEAIKESYSKEELGKENLLQKNMSFLPSKNEVKKTFDDTMSRTFEKPASEISKMLKIALEDYQKKDTGKLQLFEIALLTTKLKKQAFPKDSIKRYETNYDSFTDFEKIATSDFKKSSLLRFANKLSFCSDLQETDNSISKEAVLIAINTSAKPDKIQNVINDVTKKFENKSKKEAILDFKKEMQKNPKETVYDVVTLVKSAEITAKIVGSITNRFDNLNYSDFDKSISKTPITENKKFNSSLKKLSNTPIFSDFSKNSKSMNSGANNVRNNNLNRFFQNNLSR